MSVIAPVKDAAKPVFDSSLSNASTVAVSPPSTETPKPAERYAELAELAGSFIHEIKNHLGTLGLNLQLLAEDFQDPVNHRDRRAMERIHRLQAECAQLVDVSNDFLRFARIQDLQIAPTSIAAVVEDIVAFFSPTAQQSRIEVKCYVPSDLPLVRLDADLFKQALLNLFLNAQQAMPEGGQLTIQAKHFRESVADLSNENGQGCVELCLIDTGKGMCPDVLAKIFRPFFSTKPGGSGLGLATTRRIIEAHGGSIAVESAVDRGTRFTITLPVDGSIPGVD
jgi:signal transduction histidine kinase